ncbi:hypothetical protein QW131_20990 [Roseibium salinum]|nr:hypothetical protein [Roseibium salinum]
MDKSEHGPLNRIPVQALSLRLARTPIRMQHAQTWRIDKINPVHDLVFCLTGKARYRVGEESFVLHEGEAMLIRARERFHGVHGGGDDYTGVAQHFTLDLFGRADLIDQMHLQRRVKLRDWSVLHPLIVHYRTMAATTSPTLVQHHQFMVLLLAFLDDAFLGWREEGGPACQPGAALAADHAARLRPCRRPAERGCAGKRRWSAFPITAIISAGRFASASA